MTKAKSSRKGKKEWRKNILTNDHDEYLSKESRIERSGGHLTKAPDSEIFFVDKSQAEVSQRKVDRHRTKILHCDKALQRNSLVPAVSWPIRNKLKGKKPKESKPHVLQSEAPPKTMSIDSNSADLWDENGALTTGPPRAGALSKVGKHRGVENKILETEKQHRPAPAVEVDVPGCSYNPGFEDHQDALGLAVAQEVQKVLTKELQPEAPPRVQTSREGLGLSEEDRYFLEVDEEDPEAEDEEEPAEGPSVVSKPVQVKKLTRADLNRKLRRRAAEAEEKKKLNRKRERTELERLRTLEVELGEEAEEREKRRVRRDTAREDRLAAAPPKLGPHKFEPEAINVLLSEEVSGSLRRLKGCSTLARDRFKSLQRRGLVEPRVPVKRRQAKNRRTVIQGSQGQKEKEMHAEILAMRAARKKGKDLDVLH